MKILNTITNNILETKLLTLQNIIIQLIENIKLLNY